MEPFSLILHVRSREKYWICLFTFPTLSTSARSSKHCLFDFPNPCISCIPWILSNSSEETKHLWLIGYPSGEVYGCTSFHPSVPVLFIRKNPKPFCRNPRLHPHKVGTAVLPTYLDGEKYYFYNLD